jgi:hypothetical protein
MKDVSFQSGWGGNLQAGRTRLAGAVWAAEPYRLERTMSYQYQSGLVSIPLPVGLYSQSDYNSPQSPNRNQLLLFNEH